MASFLMSQKRPSSAAALSLLKRQGTNTQTRNRASNFHCATRCISAVAAATSEGQQEAKGGKTVSRPIGHGGAGLSA